MEAKQIAKMGRELDAFLGEFDDCFSRSEPREHLRTYVGGQLSDLPRKSVEPIALAAGVRPRTLQGFLSLLEWDSQRMVDRMQWMVARDHGDRQAIGVVDETAHPKKGRHTACVQRQWCGATGKVDNCVVSVHIAYAADDVHCLLDSDLYLPASWAQDAARRREVGIPPEAHYRKKSQIALAQIRRALGNGIRVAAWTFDENYGKEPDFLDGLEAVGQSYVGEVPSTFRGWSHPPRVLGRPTPRALRKGGPRLRCPRLARQAPAASEVRNLVRYSPAFREQPWQRFKIKDGEKGPIVWEVKAAPFYRRGGPERLPGPMHTLIVARNVLDPQQVKYFVSNRVPGSDGVSLEWMLWVAFSRWPVERCFEVGKRELGMDHFEARSWRAIHRHLAITQLTLLFCARVHQRLRGKKRSRVCP